MNQSGPWRRRLDRTVNLFRKGQELQPFRLLREDMDNVRQRYVSDWTVFNQLVIASTVYVFFTNLLPGITFAGDLYALTGQAWGTIEVVFSTGLCGMIFALWVDTENSETRHKFDLEYSFSAQPLTILGVTGPFTVLAESIYNLCEKNFGVRLLGRDISWTEQPTD